MLTAQVEIGMSDTSGGKVKRTVVLIILIIFAVVTPAWSADLPRVDIDYILDLYNPVETFGFYKDAEGNYPIGSDSDEGTIIKPLPIDETHPDVPQFYYIIKSNMSGHKFTFQLSASMFEHNGNESIPPVGYTLRILDKESKHVVLEKEVITEDITSQTLNAGYMEVTSSTKPQNLGFEFYYIFDQETLSQLAEGDYISTVTMGVTVNE